MNFDDKIAERQFDDDSVTLFAEMMKSKLDKKREQGYTGWNNPDLYSKQHLVDLFINHITKGDCVDLANFCMMMKFRSCGQELQQSRVMTKDQLLQEIQSCQNIWEKVPLVLKRLYNKVFAA